MKIAIWIKNRVGLRARRLLRRLVEYCLWLISCAPTHALRINGWRLFGAKIGPDVALGRGANVLYPWRLSVGAHTIIGVRASLDARGALSIGSNCNIAADIAIWTAEHDIQSPDFAMTVAPVVIGNRAWICHRSILLPGITVGEGSVVASGSVVTKDVPPFSVAAGVPAKIIGKRTTDLTYELGRNKT